ncbi:hypothetical protein GCM10023215_21050 [Pseudonocardia yuanmonensis]|uniref:Terminase small subunit n=1 Tax=Pseudonocardia yuanmonensis TaxID=1095914 RepID=A0ABP8WD86_9PSEU
MGVTGRKPKPPGQAVNRNKPTHDWTEVPRIPFEGGPDLPEGGVAWPAATVRWWDSVRRMPHAVLWDESDWRFALDTALIHAAMHAGDVRVATELRNREKVLGTTMDFRRDLRIRYVDPEPEAAPAAPVTKLDDYRGLYG